MKDVFGIQFTTRHDGVLHFVGHGTMMRTERNLALMRAIGYHDAEIRTYRVPTSWDRTWAKLRGRPAPALPEGVDDWFLP